MPTFTFPIGSILKVQTICTVPGQISVLTTKWQMTNITGGSQFPTTDFLTEFDSQMGSLMQPLLSNGAQYYGTQVYLMNPIGPAPRPDSFKGNTVAGTGGAGLMPTQVSGLISFYTPQLGKVGQGRAYIPFPSLAAGQSDGTPTPEYLANLSALATFLRVLNNITAGAISGDFEHVLYQGGSATPLFITDATPRDAFATQRRRGAYGRVNTPPF